MLSEHQRLSEQIKALEKQIGELPEGKLVISHGSTDAKWYRSDGHQKTYIPKNQRTLAEKLALKKYLSITVKDMIQEQKSIEFYLKHHRNNTGATEDTLLCDKEFQSLLNAHFTPKSTELQQWLSSSYNKNPKHPEHLIHKSSSGHYVRSKSEAMIDTLLYLNKIPFRYECELVLDDNIFYPDFTLRHPKTGDFYYWEHFGLMDDEPYVKSAYSKLQFYTLHGLKPSVNLIATFETKNSPLSPEMVLQIINYYFT